MAERAVEIARAREAIERGFPEEAVDRLEPFAGDPEADALLARARERRRLPIMPPTDAELARRRRAMRLVYAVTALTAVTGLVAAVLIGTLS